MRKRIARNGAGQWCVVRAEWFPYESVGKRVTYTPIPGLSPYATYEEAVKASKGSEGEGRAR